MAVGDVNGDGIPDLAVVYSLMQNSTVNVLLGNGDGSFQPPINYPVGSYPDSVTVGDFNGDGLPDLAVTNSVGVHVLLGNGDGSFRTSTVSYVAGKFPASVAVGDFDGDGKSDLTVANYFSGDVSILLNDGNWGSPHSGPGGGLPGGRAAAAVLKTRASPVRLGLLARGVLPFDPNPVALVPPLATTVSVVRGSPPLLRADADQGSTQAALAGESAPPPAAPVLAGARAVAPALLDRFFAEPVSGWLWDPSADEPWWFGL